MSVTTMIILAVIVLAVAGFFVLRHYKNKNLEQLYNQVYETSKQVPKQKKMSFLLLMFRETMLASKKKTRASAGGDKLNNPKYLGIQMMQMTKVLKDRDNVQDKMMKRSLTLLDSYLVWEGKKNADAKAEKAAGKEAKDASKLAAKEAKGAAKS